MPDKELKDLLREVQRGIVQDTVDDSTRLKRNLTRMSPTSRLELVMIVSELRRRAKEDYNSAVANGDKSKIHKQLLLLAQCELADFGLNAIVATIDIDKD